MKRQNSSVIMSAKDTSQRSSFSCSSSWWARFLWRRDAAMAAYAAAFSALGASASSSASGAGRGGTKVISFSCDDARVVAGLDREDALDDHRAGVQLLGRQLLQARLATGR